MEIENNKIKNLHEPGLKGILDILVNHGTFKKYPIIITGILSFIVCVSLLVFHVDTFKILGKTSTIIQSIFPALLGFSLGGYSIAIGFSNTDLIKEAVKFDKHNLYQILSGIFALSILIQVIATILGLVINWSISVDFCNLFKISLPYFISNGVNIVLIFLLLFSASYSLVLIPYVVINLFTLSQLNSIYYTIEKLKNQK